MKSKRELITMPLASQATVVPLDILHSNIFIFFFIWLLNKLIEKKMNFKRLVWKATTLVGHGVAFSNKPIGKFYRITFVADYKPSGNFNCPSGCIANVLKP
jgi:hypothetical protein